MQELPNKYIPYREIDKSFVFPNGSRIKCSYFANDNDALQYQGQEFDVIFLEEATQFTMKVFDTLKACLRGANPFPKRMYLTCNPDGIGFMWVKRLFVTRDFLENENPDDYMFIQALVDDNMALVNQNPDYLTQLESLPEDMRMRWRWGSWDYALGQYFDEFRVEDHVIEPFPIPSEWRRYRAIDYGLDMLACVFVAVDSTGCAYVYKETGGSNLPIGIAGKQVIDFTERDEKIYCTLAPPDLWNRSQETGKSKALLFDEAGLTLTKSNNDREAGWLAIKELLRKDANGEPRLKFFNTCRETIKCLPALIRDEKKPTDCATEPHEITHYPDALRYFCIYWHRPGETVDNSPRTVWTADMWEDYYSAESESEKEYIMKKYGKPR
jgi:phage terminase large subunit